MLLLHTRGTYRRGESQRDGARICGEKESGAEWAARSGAPPAAGRAPAPSAQPSLAGSFGSRPRFRARDRRSVRRQQRRSRLLGRARWVRRRGGQDTEEAAGRGGRRLGASGAGLVTRVVVVVGATEPRPAAAACARCRDRGGLCATQRPQRSAGTAGTRSRPAGTGKPLSAGPAPGVERRAGTRVGPTAAGDSPR